MKLLDKNKDKRELELQAIHEHITSKEHLKSKIDKLNSEQQAKMHKKDTIKRRHSTRSGK